MYLQSASCISAQDSLGFGLPASWTPGNGERMALVEPAYEGILDPRLLRRMGRVLRMGGAAALDCWSRSGHERPDAIIAGTAMGCLQDTEVFLRKMTEQKEQLLTPTAFIQSTHNTVAAQVALMLKCPAYNNTFVHRGFSFEHALTDAGLLLGERPGDMILAGGVDELTADSLALMQRLGIYHRQGIGKRGNPAGEGAAFFALTGLRRPGALARLEGMKLLRQPGINEWNSAMISLLEETGTSPDEIDLVLTGTQSRAALYPEMLICCHSLMPAAPVIDYKPYCGEFATASAFGLWMGAGILAQGQLPALIGPADKKIERVLICNNYLDRYFSFMVLTHAELPD